VLGELKGSLTNGPNQIQVRHFATSNCLVVGQVVEAAMACLVPSLMVSWAESHRWVFVFRYHDQGHQPRQLSVHWVLLRATGYQEHDVGPGDWVCMERNYVAKTTQSHLVGARRGCSDAGTR
jgi:hypothetical protein